jgi:hypothetical protein
MQKTTALTILLLITVMIVPSLADDVMAPTIYKPICLSCGGPTPVPTPTPIPASQVEIGFDMPNKIRTNNALSLSGYQISGNPLSPLAGWSWQYRDGSTTKSLNGQTVTITPRVCGTMKVTLKVSDFLTNSYGSCMKSIDVR